MASILAQVVSSLEMIRHPTRVSLGLTALDDDWVTLNQMIKYYKMDLQSDYYVNEEIRLGRMIVKKDSFSS